jgi:hypothetical protein
VKPPRRVPPTVLIPLTQRGALYVETIETRDPENEARHTYEYIWRRHRIVKARRGRVADHRSEPRQVGRLELRLARIREIEPPLPRKRETP